MFFALAGGAKSACAPRDEAENINPIRDELS
jgi:hypothetical protein